MKLSASWIDAPDSQRVLEVLEGGGHQALFVGGCIRNTILGAPITDIDIATSAEPERVMELAEDAGIKAVPTGIDHGTITLVSSGVAHEVTTFRRDIETDGRRAVVAFSTDVSDDARRRDFTMNALYATRQGDVVDPLGGLADLKARRVRFIEDADIRIREDYLRILRFFRFHAWYGNPEGGLDEDGLSACAENASGLETISRERIGAEFMKMLAAPDPCQSAAAMEHAGVLGQILPGATLRALFPLVHLEGGAGDALRRLAVIGGQDVGERLRLSRADARMLEMLRAEIAMATTLPELAYRHGAAFAQSVALCRAAVLEAPVMDDTALLEDAEAQTFPIKAADLSLEGRALGEALKRLEKVWIDSGFTLTRADLLTRPEGKP